MMQSLPSLSQILLPPPTVAEVGGATGIGRLSVDATRELAKCANGELVSHDVVRDGIDALLQLKRASYDLGAPDESSWSEGGNSQLRPPPERACYGPPEHGRSQWMECSVGVKEEESSSDEEEESSEEEVEEVRHGPIGKERRRMTSSSGGGRGRIQPPHLTKKPPPPQNRPPTIWHHRKSDPSPLVPPTPESPKSKISSPPEEDESDVDDDEPSGPAVLHFSCLQCHRAKKRCNRTRPCSRCVSRGMENECRYPDKHDPRAVLRACLRCWQTKKKCDRKQPSCGKCDKVGVQCVYRRENLDAPESPVQQVQVPTPTLTMSPPPMSRMSRVPSDASAKSIPPPTNTTVRKRKMTDDTTTSERPENHQYSTRGRSIADHDELTDNIDPSLKSASSKRVLRSRK